MANDTRTHQVTLGCGTMILIAIIVMFFSRPGISELEREVRNLRNEVADLKKSIDAQTREMAELQRQIKKANGVQQ